MWLRQVSEQLPSSPESPLLDVLNDSAGEHLGVMQSEVDSFTLIGLHTTLRSGTRRLSRIGPVVTSRPKRASSSIQMRSSGHWSRVASSGHCRQRRLLAAPRGGAPSTC
jgi:hypothetical protein